MYLFYNCYFIVFSNFGLCSRTTLKLRDAPFDSRSDFMFGVHEVDVHLSSANKLFLSSLSMQKQKKMFTLETKSKACVRCFLSNFYFFIK